VEKTTPKVPYTQNLFSGTRQQGPEGYLPLEVIDGKNDPKSPIHPKFIFVRGFGGGVGGALLPASSGAFAHCAKAESTWRSPTAKTGTQGDTRETARAPSGRYGAALGALVGAGGFRLCSVLAVQCRHCTGECLLVDVCVPCGDCHGLMSASLLHDLHAVASLYQPRRERVP
jgi:hypothetical protein